MSEKNKLKKILLILFILVPAISLSIFLYINKDYIGFSRKNIKQSTYIVNGMTCQSCVKAVSNALNDMKFVSKATVNYEEKTVTIKFNFLKVSYFDFNDRLKEDGYTLSFQESQKLINLNVPR